MHTKPIRLRHLIKFGWVWWCGQVWNMWHGTNIGLGNSCSKPSCWTTSFIASCNWKWIISQFYFDFKSCNSIGLCKLFSKPNTNLATFNMKSNIESGVNFWCQRVLWCTEVTFEPFENTRKTEDYATSTLLKYQKIKPKSSSLYRVSSSKSILWPHLIQRGNNWRNFWARSSVINMKFRNFELQSHAFTS